MLLLAAVNLALSPLVPAWQGLHALYSRAELLRREPGALATRRWSLLARLQLRHFNELPHELRARLARASRPAAAFLRAPAPVLALLARQLVFFAGALFAALLVLTVCDKDVLYVEHVLTAMTALGIVASGQVRWGRYPGRGHSSVLGLSLPRIPTPPTASGPPALHPSRTSSERQAPSASPSRPLGLSFRVGRAKVVRRKSRCRRPWRTCTTSRRPALPAGPALTGRWRGCCNTER